MLANVRKLPLNVSNFVEALFKLLQLDESGSAQGFCWCPPHQIKGVFLDAIYQNSEVISPPVVQTIYWHPILSKLVGLDFKFIGLACWYKPI